MTAHSTAGRRAAVDERVGVVASAGSGHPCRARHDRLETNARRLTHVTWRVPHQTSMPWSRFSYSAMGNLAEVGPHALQFTGL